MSGPPNTGPVWCQMAIQPGPKIIKVVPEDLEKVGYINSIRDRTIMESGTCTGFYESSMILKRSQRFAACSLTSKPHSFTL